MKEFFTDEELKYIKETQKNISLSIKWEWNIYKKMVKKPYSYWTYSIFAKTMTMNEIIKRERKSFVRWGWRPKLNKRDRDYIKYATQFEFGHNYIKNIAMTLWISIPTVYKYKNK